MEETGSASRRAQKEACGRTGESCSMRVRKEHKQKEKMRGEERNEPRNVVCLKFGTDTGMYRYYYCAGFTAIRTGSPTEATGPVGCTTPTAAISCPSAAAAAGSVSVSFLCLERRRR